MQVDIFLNDNKVETISTDKFVTLFDLRPFLEFKTNYENFVFLAKIGKSSLSVVKSDEPFVNIEDIAVFNSNHSENHVLNLKTVPKTAIVSLEDNEELKTSLESHEEELRKRVSGIRDIVMIQRTQPEIVIYVEDAKELKNPPMWIGKFHCTYLQNETVTNSVQSSNAHLGISVKEPESKEFFVPSRALDIQAMKAAIENCGNPLITKIKNIRMIHKGDLENDLPSVSVGVKTAGFIPLGSPEVPRYIWANDKPIKTQIEELSLC